MMGLDCKEVTRQLASDEPPVNRRGRFLLALHLFLCNKCRRYKAQLEIIGKTARDLWARPRDDEALGRLRDRIFMRDS